MEFQGKDERTHRSPKLETNSNEQMRMTERKELDGGRGPWDLAGESEDRLFH